MFACLTTSLGLRVLFHCGFFLTAALLLCLDTAFAQPERTLLRMPPERIALLSPADPAP